MFIFDGGVLSDERVTRLRPVDPELSRVRFVTLDQAQHMLRPYVWRRAFHALEVLRTGQVRYLQDSQPVDDNRRLRRRAGVGLWSLWMRIEKAAVRIGSTPQGRC